MIYIQPKHGGQKLIINNNITFKSNNTKVKVSIRRTLLLRYKLRNNTKIKT